MDNTILSLSKLQDVKYDNTRMAEAMSLCQVAVPSADSYLANHFLLRLSGFVIW